MLKRPVAAFLCITLLLQSTACYSSRRRAVVPVDLGEPAVESIIGVTTADGQVVEFDRVPPAIVRGDSIHAFVGESPFAVAFTDIDRVWVERREYSTTKTIGATVGVVTLTLVAAAAIALATKESCPFVYSWDGSAYVFDAEPYGGAITLGLERDDYAQLENLRPDGDIYSLRVTNEVNEVQYNNLLELWVVDHPANVGIAADEWGGLHTLGSLQPPVEARDATGGDLLPWLTATDWRIWEPPAVPGPDGSYRQDIVLSFPKPADAQAVKLVVNAATGLWGSHMIRSMLQARGDDIDEWYAGIDERISARDSLLEWNLREELYALKIYVEEPTGWEVRGILPGGGPFIAEHRVVRLDVSRALGSELRIRIQPPRGFWALNSFAVDYSPNTDVHVTRLAPATARDHRGADVLTQVSAGDDRYYVMPETGDWADVTFHAPAAVPAHERTIFLHSRGYYRLNLSAGGEPQTALLREIEEVPGAPARIAAEEYAAYRSGQTR